MSLFCPLMGKVGLGCLPPACRCSTQCGLLLLSLATIQNYQELFPQMMIDGLKLEIRNQCVSE